MVGDPPLIIRAVRLSEYVIAGEVIEAYRTLGDAGDEFYDRDARHRRAASQQ
jgi:hypothetical protein